MHPQLVTKGWWSVGAAVDMGYQVCSVARSATELEPGAKLTLEIMEGTQRAHAK